MDWHANLSSTEIPPSWMWPFDELTGDWIDEVLEARKQGSTIDRDDTDWDSMEQNELSPRYAGSN